MSKRYDLAVLGSPVGHSRSPAMHEAGLAAAGLSGSYVAIEVDEAGMSVQAERLRRSQLHGANITMPHKRTAARLADVLTPGAFLALAVGRVIIEKWRGATAGIVRPLAGARYKNPSASSGKGAGCRRFIMLEGAAGAVTPKTGSGGGWPAG